jgi:ADP-ribose diphosphatase
VSQKKPVIHKVTSVAHSRLFEIEAVDLEFSNGTCVQYERMRGSMNGAVLIVPMLDDATMLLIREYVVGAERYELAFPKGRIESEEPVLDAANREIMEEIGYAATTLTPIYAMSLAPGFLCSTTHIVLAEGLYAQRCEGDEPEELEVVPWRLADIQSLLAQKDFTEARSIAALYMVKEYLQNRNQG